MLIEYIFKNNIPAKYLESFESNFVDQEILELQEKLLKEDVSECFVEIVLRQHDEMQQNLYL